MVLWAYTATAIFSASLLTAQVVGQAALPPCPEVQDAGFCDHQGQAMCRSEFPGFIAACPRLCQTCREVTVIPTSTITAPSTLLLSSATPGLNTFSPAYSPTNTPTSGPTLLQTLSPTTTTSTEGRQLLTSTATQATSPPAIPEFPSHQSSVAPSSASTSVCHGMCGQYLLAERCWCTSDCRRFGDCCVNADLTCFASTSTSAPSPTAPTRSPTDARTAFVPTTSPTFMPTLMLCNGELDPMFCREPSILPLCQVQGSGVSDACPATCGTCVLPSSLQPPSFAVTGAPTVASGYCNGVRDPDFCFSTLDTRLCDVPESYMSIACPGHCRTCYATTTQPDSTQSPTTACTNHECANGAICEAFDSAIFEFSGDEESGSGDSVRNYSCICPAGFEGHLCDESVVPCIDDNDFISGAALPDLRACSDVVALFAGQNGSSCMAVDPSGLLARRCCASCQLLEEVPTAIAPVDDIFSTVTPSTTALPIFESTVAPTAEPTAAPTAEPTAAPTFRPTARPTIVPSTGPTEEPTQQPTQGPTVEPTQEPTTGPTTEPTTMPTIPPTVPTPRPTTTAPSMEPTSGAPSYSPTISTFQTSSSTASTTLGSDDADEDDDQDDAPPTAPSPTAAPTFNIISGSSGDNTHSGTSNVAWQIPVAVIGVLVILMIAVIVYRNVQAKRGVEDFKCEKELPMERVDESIFSSDQKLAWGEESIVDAINLTTMKSAESSIETDLDDAVLITSIKKGSAGNISDSNVHQANAEGKKQGAEDIVAPAPQLFVPDTDAASPRQSALGNRYDSMLIDDSVAIINSPLEHSTIAVDSVDPLDALVTARTQMNAAIQAAFEELQRGPYVVNDTDSPSRETEGQSNLDYSRQRGAPTPVLPSMSWVPTTQTTDLDQ